MRRRPWLVALVIYDVLVWGVILLSSCEFTTEPILICYVDGDTIDVPNDSTGIRCAPLPDSVPAP